MKDMLEAARAGKTVIPKLCPVCGKPMRMILWGMPTKVTEDIVQANPTLFSLGGCCCFGDDRDPVYECPECSAEFTEKLVQIRLINCQLGGKQDDQ